MTIHDFFRWWRAQLADIVPSSWHRLVRRASAPVTLRIEGHTVTVVQPSGGMTDTFDLKAANSQTVQLDTLPQRLHVILSSDHFLVRHFSMPAAVKPNLDEAVSYQLPKLTPFSADQVLYACGTGAEAPTDGKLPVWLVAVPKKQLLPALAAIGQQPPPGRLPLDAPPAEQAALEFSWRVSTPNAGRKRWNLGWIGVLAIFAFALGLHLHNRQESVEQHEEKLAQLRSKAAEVENLRQRHTDAVAQVEWIGQRKGSTTAAIVLLNTLTKMLDDGTSLQRLDFDGDDLTLTGVSASPSSMIETLESSDMFRNVRVDAFTRHGVNSANRFNLSAQMDHAPVESGS